MTQRKAHYAILRGLPGYMPDSSDVDEFRTRGDMVKSLAQEIEYMGFPHRAARQINMVQLWRYIQDGGRRGHFTIQHGGRIIEFRQIERLEYEERLELDLA
jgi:hypothetical protein